MVMFSTNGKKSDQKNIKDSAANIIETEEFVVSMVSKALLKSMNTSSGNYSKNVDEFEICDLQKANCNLVSVPRISKSPASLECKLFQVLKLPGKDNNMIIGEVVGIHLSDYFLKNGIFNILDFMPIARLGYKDYTTISKKFTLERPD
ncbi:MAG: flavin reductase family protein [Paracoccaceae bacterium]|nr:flavin reductase family protein [Paracoccaceae bacterium]